MNTFFFNTGVVPFHNPPVKLSEGQVWRDGTKQIPFDCDNVPENAVFMFACDNPDLQEYKDPGETVIVRLIHNSTLCSKYAYFRV